MRSMQPLTDLIHFQPAPTAEETPEDIFASAPGLIFPDDLRCQHGDAGGTIVYRSARFGDVCLQTADPDGEEERRLFGHYLWNAGVLMAERISGLRLPGAEEGERTTWDVGGETVLELGAGVGLVGMVACMAGAGEVVISDYPAKVMLDAIRENVKRNETLFGEAKPTVQGHEWGALDDSFSMSRQNSFSRVLAADCFWMPQVHEELVQSMLHFLSLDAEARVLAIGGFHTGRAKLAAFFDTAAIGGLVVEDIYEEDANGVRRVWEKEKDGGCENQTERKKWLTIAVLRRNIT